MLKKLVTMKDLTRDDILSIIRKARALAGNNLVCSNLFSSSGVLLFTQPSTRTLGSFYRAMKYLSMDVLVLNHSAREKGESLKRTLETLATLEYDIAVVRDDDLEDREYPLSVISAGALQDHPTQALADLAALSLRFPTIEGIKVNFRGDVDRSRVAHSTSQVLELLGARIMHNAPLEECDVVYQIRQQVERGRDLSDDEYRIAFGLGVSQVQAHPNIKAVLHAGPVMVGVEMEQDLLDSSFSLVSEQVRFGLYTRIALLESMLVNHGQDERSDSYSGGPNGGSDGVQVLRSTPSWRPISMVGHTNRATPGTDGTGDH